MKRNGKEKSEKMIVLELRFWTNHIARNGKVRAKHAWTSGMVRARANTLHGIKAKRTRPFYTLADMPATVQRVLIEHGITLHPSGTQRKYLRA
jgi:hypothetical protein